MGAVEHSTVAAVACSVTPGNIRIVHYFLLIFHLNHEANAREERVNLNKLKKLLTKDSFFLVVHTMLFA